MFGFNKKKKSLYPRKVIARKKHFKINLPLIFGVILTIVIIILLSLFIKFITSDRFRIDKFEYLGTKSISQDELNLQLTSFNGQSIFLVSNTKISKKLLASFVFFNDVKVKKKWPNQLTININERKPKMVMINLNGAYVIDEDARIIKTITTDKINFNDQDLMIIKGMGDPNGSYVTDVLFSNWKKIHPTSNETEFKIENISIDEKLKALENIYQELSQKSTDRFTVFQTAVSQTEYADLSRVIVYENKNYNEFEYINTAIVNLSVDVSDFFTINQKEAIKGIYWKGNYLLEIELANGKHIIFGTQRNISDQLDDYLLVKSQLSISGNNYYEINLSSKKIAVR
ncbi:MAG: FtsQ-type POTRA domain-containing protein [bacterium]